MSSSILTLNHCGHMLTDLHEIGRDFVSFSPSAPGPVLDIGTAYGFVALKALEAGAYVIANDLEKEHLNILRKKVSKEYLERIAFVSGCIPGDVNFRKSSLGAVLASGVLHYLSPENLTLAIKNITQWLSNGGKFFLATPTPYTNLYENFLPIYKERKRIDSLIPGYIEDASKILPSFINDIPKSIYLIEKETIIKELKKNGFVIEKVIFFDIEFQTDQSNKETNILGIIAVKV